MKKLFSIGLGRTKSPAKSPVRNRILTEEERTALNAQQEKLAEQQAKAAARKKAQQSAKAQKPRNRLVHSTEVNPQQPSSKNWLQRLRKKKSRSASERAARAQQQSIGPIIRDVLSGEFLTREGVTRHIPYLIFVSGLFIAYIAMGYQFERIEREKLQTKRQLEELSAEYKTIKAEFETQLQQSTVEQNIADLGLRQTVEPPVLLEFEAVAP